MKKIFAVVALVLVLFALSCPVKASDPPFSGKNLYPMTTVLVDINDECKLITCKDFNGNEWCFTDLEGDWVVGDIVSMIMYDRGTPIIYDDEIVSVRYDGWFDGWKW